MCLGMYAFTNLIVKLLYHLASPTTCVRDDGGLEEENTRIILFIRVVRLGRAVTYIADDVHRVKIRIRA